MDDDFLTMTAEQECFVYVVVPGATEFVTAGRLS